MNTTLANKSTGLWLSTSFYGSILYALTFSIQFKNSSLEGAFTVFMVTLILSFILSLIASIPLLVFTLFIRKETPLQSTWKRIRNFQILLCGLYLIGFACGTHWMDSDIWFQSLLLFAYLTIGLINWKHGIFR